jgi:sugar phosphate isomerase/epimerase
MKMPINLACSTICFRNSPVETALEEIQGFGFEAVDLAVIPGFCDHFDAARQSGAEREDFVALVRRSGLRVPTVTAVPGHFNAPDADEQLIVNAGVQNLKLAALLGAEALNVHCGQPTGDLQDRRGFKQQAEAQAAGLKRIAREAAELGLNLNVEAPHRNGLCRTLDEAELLLDKIDEPNARFLLDVTHVHAGGARTEEAVRRMGGRLGYVHLRDGVGENIFLVPGDGEIDFRAFFTALEASGYAGYAAFELEGAGETLEGRREGLRRAIDFILTQADEFTGLQAAAFSI